MPNDGPAPIDPQPPVPETTYQITITRGPLVVGVVRHTVRQSRGDIRRAFLVLYGSIPLIPAGNRFALSFEEASNTDPEWSLAG